MFYSDNTIKTFLKFENTGIIKGSDATSKVVNKDNGEIYKIYTKIENNKIVEATFQAFGSALVFASLGAAVTLILNKTADEIRKIGNKDIIDVIGDYPVSREHVIDYTIETIKKLAREIDEFTGKNKVKKENKKQPVKVENKQETKVEATPQEPVIAEKVVKSPNKKVSTTKIITITHGAEDDVKSVTVENHEKMTAEDIKEIIDSKVASSEEPVKIAQSETKVADTKKKHVKRDSLLGEDDSDDVQNEIDDITAKLAEAINNLNFKFDDTEE